MGMSGELTPKQLGELWSVCPMLEIASGPVKERHRAQSTAQDFIRGPAFLRLFGAVGRRSRTGCAA